MKNYERIVSCVKEGANVIVEIPFVDIRPNDTVFTDDEAIKVNTFCAGVKENFITSDEGEKYLVDDLLSGVKPYVIGEAIGSEYYLPHADHVERNDMLYIDGEWINGIEDDEQAAKAAEADGVKLIYGMTGIPDGVYVDTPENRAILLKEAK